jgi:hypothetical protein
MQIFTAWQYLLIEVANHFGLDKFLFEDRIKWAEDHLHNLEEFIDQVGLKDRPLYIKAVQTIRKAQKGIPTGHLVGFDASCSGIQIMSVLTGCEAGARSTGLIDPDVRADAYSQTTQVMNRLLGDEGISVPRTHAKNALMTAFYGSTAQPKAIFGDGTAALDAFYKAAQEVAPGAWELLNDLAATWNPTTLVHAWQLPDGFEAKVKVKTNEETRIEVDELGGASFTYQYKEYMPLPQGHKDAKSNPANVVHSVDAYVVRCMQRRCNYDKDSADLAMYLINKELEHRANGGQADESEVSKAVAYYMNLYASHKVADAVILPHLTSFQVKAMSTEHLEKLGSIVESMLCYEPFEVITVHDEFKCHPNNMNFLRSQYINIMCDLAEGTVLNAIMSSLFGQPTQYKKLSNNLSEKIVHSNYALC